MRVQDTEIDPSATGMVREGDESLVMVVNPVRDEAASIEDCLAYVLAEDYEALQPRVTSSGTTLAQTRGEPDDRTGTVVNRPSCSASPRNLLLYA